MKYLILCFTFIFMVGCTNTETPTPTQTGNDEEITTQQEKVTDTAVDAKETSEESKAKTTAKEETVAETIEEKATEKTTAKSKNDPFKGYKLIEVDGGDQSGYRESKVVVDIGFGNREYWAFTNEYGQLVHVIADKVILQDDDSEPVTSSGRYYSDEAKVPGVESPALDEGHVLADSLGGVSNAYNITPQDSTLNRHGDQAYMEDAIRKAGGATDFEAIITYPNTKTQIPSHYKYTYTIRGNKVTDEFDNGNPDETNKSLGLTKNKATTSNSSTNGSTTANGNEDVSAVDTNGNGQVTIKEAKDAGFSMPITRDHWLYQYMDDRDGDGSVGE
ncbi:MAG: hypothetical protein KBT36_06485 [Kurthia sp.]|nr:hypothetical protein [Candidatus Kurthia equi]